MTVMRKTSVIIWNCNLPSSLNSLSGFTVPTCLAGAPYAPEKRKKMTTDEKNMLRGMMDDIEKLGHIRSEDLPNIDLYMDQVTTFMEQQLASTKRYPEDKILTKTMINNYAKNNLLPSPEKKKYSKDHMLILTFIYYFKNILSISDIQTLLGPITERYFKGKNGKDMTYIYDEVFGMEKAQTAQLTKNLLRDYHAARNTFEDADEEDKDFLKMFSFICELSFDVYLKTMIIEKLIDGLPPKQPDNKKVKK